jgi:hypothetical protein
MGALLLTAIVFLLMVFGALLWAFLLWEHDRSVRADTTTPRPVSPRPLGSIRPVSMWPYVVVCYICTAFLSVMEGLGVTRLGLAPSIGVATPFIAIPFSIWLFTRFHRRTPIASERWGLVLGSFAATWIFDSLKNTVSVLTRQSVPRQDVANVVVATLIDLIGVTVIVHCSAWIAGRLLASARSHDAA